MSELSDFDDMYQEVIIDHYKNPRNSKKLSGSYDNLAFSAALELVFEGKNQSCGYVEDILIKYRRKFLERNQ